MKKRIFALDNEKNLLDLIKELLVDEYTEVVLCNNPHNAISELMSDKKGFDLIISDIHMDDYTGFDFVEELRSHKNYYYIPVLFLTAMEDDKLRIKAYTNNVFDYLVKPLNTKTFKYKIHSILDNYDELRKSAFTIKKGKFDGKILPKLIKEAEIDKLNGFLIIQNKRQGLCKIEFISGYMESIHFKDKKNDEKSDDAALDKVLKWRTGQFIVYHQEIKNYFEI